MKIAIVSVIKNEHLYLEEWIKYHLDLGFDSIYLYEDEGESHSEIVNKYPNVFLDKATEPRFDIQIRTVNNFLNSHKDEYDWVAHIDIDEFITCNEPLKECLSKFNFSILMKWINFNANGHFYRPEGSIIKNYTLACGYLKSDRNYWVYKSFGKTSMNPVWKNPHYVNLYIHQSDIYIRHYITKSFLDYCWRIYERGDMYKKQYRNLNGFFALNPDFNKEECYKYIKDKYKINVN